VTDPGAASPPPGLPPLPGPPPLPGLQRVVLAGEALTRLSPILEADRAQAVADLEAENHFLLCGTPERPAVPGPYVLHLSVQEGRLVFDVRDARDAPLQMLVLSLGPFRGLIKDYQMLVDSHMLAVEEGREGRIQAIDMGRRGLHNEGAALLQERLTNKAGIDHETARRLFTLVCVLHQRI
jgi:uncharacterized protein (UPF0262 family)